jgi:release factor glutamine methyltransferase
MADATIRDCLRAARRRLAASDGEHTLLAHTLGVSVAHLLAHPEAAVNAAQRSAFEALVARRAAGEPLAYLTGRRGFWTLELVVNPAVLIPRPETELLVELALTLGGSRDGLRVLDAGTGSGCIALALASERPGWRMSACDASPAALDVARDNARRLNLGSVRWLLSDWFTALPGERFDLIVSNPPYVAADDPHLLGDGLTFEPPAALTAGPDGLDALRQLCAAAPAQLAPGGWLLLEHGFDQGAAVRELLAAAGGTAITTHRDLGGHERVSVAQYRP